MQCPQAVRVTRGSTAVRWGQSARTHALTSVCIACMDACAAPQPAGTGFSTGEVSGYAHNETQVAEDMYVFLQGFFKEFPQYQPNDFFITGERYVPWRAVCLWGRLWGGGGACAGATLPHVQLPAASRRASRVAACTLGSYGGHYVPATSHRVFLGNKNGDGVKINLKGVSVGNGLTDPSVQYKYYAQLAYNWSTTLVGAPRVTLSQYEQVRAGDLARHLVAASPCVTVRVAFCSPRADVGRHPAMHLHDSGVPNELGRVPRR